MIKKDLKKKKLEKVLYKYLFNIIENRIINNKSNILFIKSLRLSNDLCFLKIGLSFLDNNLNLASELNNIEKIVRNDLFRKHKIIGIKNIFFFNE